MADFKYSINDFDLNTYWCLSEGTMWRPSVATRRTSVRLPNYHGVLSVGTPTYEAPVLRLNHTVYSATSVLLEQNTQNLISMLTASNGVVKITRESGDQITEATGRLINVTAPVNFIPQAWVATFQSEYEISSVFFRDVDYAAIYNQNFSASQNQTVTWSGGEGSTGPITDAIVRIKGPLTEIRMTDYASGTGFKIVRSLTSSDYMYVDTSLWSAWVTTSDTAWTTTGTDVSGLIDPNVPGMLQLTPFISGTPDARIVNVVYYFVGHTSGMTNVAIRAKRSFL